jgi:riboflavin kinase / FMN adenylyltransferase
VRVVSDVSKPLWPGERAVATIGAYDGVHLGHRAVIDDVVNRAQRLNARTAVVTFDRHPASIVRPESAPLLLTDLEQKLELLAATGVEATVVVPFDAAQAAEQPADFVRRILVGALAVQQLIVGADFHFGRARAGNVALLSELGKEYDFTVNGLSLLTATGGGAPISSTAIRQALRNGDVVSAERMLGRPFEARGVVARGDQRGRSLGFPTANVEVPATQCLPADGVYAGRFERAHGSVHPAVMNLGRRPTFYEHADHSLLEAHLLDFDGDLYGESVRVRFHERIRGERKFDGLDQLVAQIANDRDAARSLLT